MALPVSFLAHLRAEGYHPRSDKHSKALARAIVEDLVGRCNKIASDAASNRIVFRVNHQLLVGSDEWKTDLAIGTAPANGIPKGAPRVAGVAEAIPTTVRIAVEAKSVMTKHTGARKNRKRDLEPHHQHVHNYSRNAIAAGITLVNSAVIFRSPLCDDVSIHRQPEDAKGVIDLMRDVRMSPGPGDPGIDALSVVVVDMDNLELADTSYVETRPAPRPGDPLHWGTFIERICSAYDERF